MLLSEGVVHSVSGGAASLSFGLLRDESPVRICDEACSGPFSVSCGGVRIEWRELMSGVQCTELPAPNSSTVEVQIDSSSVDSLRGGRRRADAGATFRLLLSTWYHPQNFLRSLYQGGRNYYSGDLGFEFRARRTFYVEALGRAVPRDDAHNISRGSGFALLEAHGLRIWDCETRRVVAYTAVDRHSEVDALGYAFARLREPIALEEGRTYAVVSRERQDGSDGFFSSYRHYRDGGGEISYRQEFGDVTAAVYCACSSKRSSTYWQGGCPCRDGAYPPDRMTSTGNQNGAAAYGMATFFPLSARTQSGDEFAPLRPTDASAPALWPHVPRSAVVGVRDGVLGTANASEAAALVWPELSVNFAEPRLPTVKAKESTTGLDKPIFDVDPAVVPVGSSIELPEPSFTPQPMRYEVFMMPDAGDDLDKAAAGTAAAAAVMGGPNSDIFGQSVRTNSVNGGFVFATACGIDRLVREGAALRVGEVNRTAGIASEWLMPWEILPRKPLELLLGGVQGARTGSAVAAAADASGVEGVLFNVVARRVVTRDSGHALQAVALSPLGYDENHDWFRFARYDVVPTLRSSPSAISARPGKMGKSGAHIFYVVFCVFVVVVAMWCCRSVLRSSRVRGRRYQVFHGPQEQSGSSPSRGRFGVDELGDSGPKLRPWSAAAAALRRAWQYGRHRARADVTTSTQRPTKVVPAHPDIVSLSAPPTSHCDGDTLRRHDDESAEGERGDNIDEDESAFFLSRGKPRVASGSWVSSRLVPRDGMLRGGVQFIRTSLINVQGQTHRVASLPSRPASEDAKREEPRVEEEPRVWADPENLSGTEWFLSGTAQRRGGVVKVLSNNKID